jgi:hypothetical protein
VGCNHGDTARPVNHLGPIVGYTLVPAKSGFGSKRNHPPEDYAIHRILLERRLRSGADLGGEDGAKG